jgi:ferrochelatase
LKLSLRWLTRSYNRVTNTFIKPMSKRAVVLLNLGSPKSTSVGDVRTYLREFLGDERVIDYPAVFRFALLEGIVLRTRPRKSAAA